MKDINNRNDIRKLVDVFYSEIRKDDFLGPIFNRMIPEDHWEIHLEKLTDFWETNLLGNICFNGNPILAHRNVDKEHDYSIGQEHFSHWLKLWNSTIDNHFDGNIANLAKNRAKNMAVSQYLKIWEVKPV